jgi:hypothetical protein
MRRSVRRRAKMAEQRTPGDATLLDLLIDGFEHALIR